MQKYVIKGMLTARMLYYAGKHYVMVGAFTPHVQQATLFTMYGDAHNMVQVLEQFYNVSFEIRSVQVTVIED